MARPTPGRPHFHYLESWLLPSLRLRANIFHWNPGYERDQDFYLDVGEITPGDGVWHWVDHYLDLVVRNGRATELIDVDELLEAHHLGLVPADTAVQAIQAATTAVEGLASHNHDLQAWLSSNAMDVSWR